ncbi:DUF4405 domain-containing protein [Thermodesulfobacteriota bacterium]
MEEIKAEFKLKTMTSILLILTLITDALSGVFLYIAPFGRYANWTGWTLWGLTKPEWGGIHTIFSYLFIIIVCFHLYYNRNTLFHFIWSKAKGVMSLKQELIVALSVVVFVFVGTLANLQPFRVVIDFGQKVKISWEKGIIKSPVLPYSIPFKQFKRGRSYRRSIFKTGHPGKREFLEMETESALTDKMRNSNEAMPIYEYKHTGQPGRWAGVQTQINRYMMEFCFDCKLALFSGFLTNKTM